MRKEPTLIIMAAGMGSRYGGLKQMDPMDDEGNVIIDYSLFDAYRAGFRRVIFVIKEENKDVFEEMIGSHIKGKFEVHYAFQNLNDIPDGFSVPEGREKPWGTGHAIYACRDLVDGPIAVINADDYYGVHAYQQIYDFLKENEDGEKYSYAMIGYRLDNTMSDKGSVARGLCEGKDGKLVTIVERTKIEKQGDKIAFTEDDGKTWTEVAGDTLVSLNIWGFTKSYMDEILDRFPKFLSETVPSNPLKSEYFVPLVVADILADDKCEVQILTSQDRWYGVTYKEDKPIVMQAFADMKASGLYPKKLWEDR